MIFTKLMVTFWALVIYLCTLTWVGEYLENEGYRILTIGVYIIYVTSLLSLLYLAITKMDTFVNWLQKHGKGND